MTTLTQETIDAFRELERGCGFMAPDLFHGPIVVDSELGPMPSEDWLSNFCPVSDADRIESEEIGWVCRLSASGYLDCTDWSGPFETEDEAIEALVDLYCE